MLKRAVAVPVIGTMLLACAAFAQTSAPSSSSATGSVSSPTTFLAQGKAAQWRASRLERLHVYNNKDERVGEIRELIMDRDGHVDAVVIGIGGFLGFREHDVAVPFDQVTWVRAAQSGAGADVARAYPQHALINATKDQLLAAPEFKYTR
jgi:sporulation protein YlmC with PRC-barrel domain